MPRLNSENFTERIQVPVSSQLSLRRDNITQELNKRDAQLIFSERVLNLEAAAQENNDSIFNSIEVNIGENRVNLAIPKSEAEKNFITTKKNVDSNRTSTKLRADGRILADINYEYINKLIPNNITGEERYKLLNQVIDQLRSNPDAANSKFVGLLSNSIRNRVTGPVAVEAIQPQESPVVEQQIEVAAVTPQTVTPNSAARNETPVMRMLEDDPKIAAPTRIQRWTNIVKNKFNEISEKYGLGQKLRYALYAAPLVASILGHLLLNRGKSEVNPAKLPTHTNHNPAATKLLASALNQTFELWAKSQSLSKATQSVTGANIDAVKEAQTIQEADIAADNLVQGIQLPQKTKIEVVTGDNIETIEVNSNANTSGSQVEITTENDSFDDITHIPVTSQFDQISREEIKPSQITHEKQPWYMSVGKHFSIGEFVPEHLEHIHSLETSKPIEVDPVIIPYLEDLVEAARNEIGIDLVVVSGYRSHDRQEAVFDGWVQSVLQKNPSMSYEEAVAITEMASARPGHSQHQTGRAVDLLPRGYDFDRLMADEAMSKKLYSWMKANSHRFGFDLPYDEHQADYITEPWHIAFMGKPKQPIAGVAK